MKSIWLAIALKSDPTQSVDACDTIVKVIVGGRLLNRDDLAAPAGLPR